MVILNHTNLSVNIGGLSLKNPVIAASGTFGYADELKDFVDIDKIGAIVTKGITLEPRSGNPQPRIKEVKNGLINSIGLENIGINSFIDNKLPVLRERDIDFILNIAGFSIEEYVKIAKIAEQNKIKNIELNVSCPNVEKGCLEFGRNPEDLYRLVSSIRDAFSGCLMVKLSSNVSDPAELALCVEKAGANAISAINTVRAMSITVNDLKVNSVVKGGLSGPAIKPIALNFIYEISRVTFLPIIGMGGISSVNDILEFFAAGACAVQIGTANFIYPNICEQLVNDLQLLMQSKKIESLQDLIKGVRYAGN